MPRQRPKITLAEELAEHEREGLYPHGTIQYRNQPGYSTTLREGSGPTLRRLPCAHSCVQELGRQPSDKEPGMLAVSRRCTHCGRAWVDYEPDEPEPVWVTVVPPQKET